MSPIKIISIAIVIILLFLGFNSVYTVDEGESALLQRLGKIVADENTETPTIFKPGLHFKIPLIDHVRIFDTRVQSLSTSTSQLLTVVTKEQTYLVVEYFAKWRIN